MPDFDKLSAGTGGVGGSSGDGGTSANGGECADGSCAGSSTNGGEGGTNPTGGTGGTDGGAPGDGGTSGSGTTSGGTDSSGGVPSQGGDAGAAGTPGGGGAGGEPAETGNRITNPDFETGISGWITWGGALSLDTEMVHGGTGSLRVSDRQAGAGTAAFNLTGLVAKGRTYKATFWVAITGAATADVHTTVKHLCVGDSTTTYTWITNPTTVEEGVWTKFTGTVAVPNCQLQDFTVYAEGPDAGIDLLVDDVVVEL